MNLLRAVAVLHSVSAQEQTRDALSVWRSELECDAEASDSEIACKFDGSRMVGLPEKIDEDWDEALKGSADYVNRLDKAAYPSSVVISMLAIDRTMTRQDVCAKTQHRSVLAFDTNAFPYPDTKAIIFNLVRFRDHLEYDQVELSSHPTNFEDLSIMGIWQRTLSSFMTPWTTDNTGQLFVINKDIITSDSVAKLIDCHPLRETSQKTVENETIIAWPPISGYFPASHVTQKDPLSTMEMDKFVRSIKLGTLSSVYNYVRTVVAAWYGDHNIHLKKDIGREIWDVASSIAAAVRGYGNPHSLKHLAIPQLNRYNKTEPPGVKRYVDEMIASDLVNGSVLKTPINAIFQRSGLPIVAPPQNIPFYASGDNDDGYPTNRGKIYTIKQSELLDNQNQSSNDLTYSVNFIANNAQRMHLSKHMWLQEGIESTAIYGINFADDDEIKNHWPTIDDSGLTLIKKKYKPALLLANFMKNIEYSCKTLGTDLVIVLEDDAFPVRNAKQAMERELAVLDHATEGKWRMHMFGNQLGASSTCQGPGTSSTNCGWNEIPTFYLNPARNSIYPPQLLFEGILPYQSFYGSYNMVINCRQWDSTLRSFFVDEHGQYILPWHAENEYERLVSYSKDKSIRSFASDGAFLAYFTLFDGLVTRSMSPLVMLSPIEWAHQTQLHNERIESGEHKRNYFQADVVNDMRTQGFPKSVHSLSRNDREYFCKHMWIVREETAFHFTFTWLRAIYNDVNLSYADTIRRILELLAKQNYESSHDNSFIIRNSNPFKRR